MDEPTRADPVGQTGHAGASAQSDSVLVNPLTDSVLLFRRTPTAGDDVLEFELLVAPGFDGKLFELDRRHPTQGEHVRVSAGRLGGYVLEHGPTSASDGGPTRTPVRLGEGESIDLKPGQLLAVRNGSTDEYTRVVVRYDPAHDAEQYIRRGYEVGSRLARERATASDSAERARPTGDGGAVASAPPRSAEESGDRRDAPTDTPSTETTAPAPEADGAGVSSSAATEGSKASHQDTARRYLDELGTRLDATSDPDVDHRVLGSEMTWGQSLAAAKADLVRSWYYLWQSDEKWRVLLVGGAILFVSGLLSTLISPWLSAVPLVFTAGYLARVCKRGMSTDSTLAAISDWKELGREGLVPAVLILAFQVFPAQILGLLLAGLGLPIGIFLISLARMSPRVAFVIFLVGGYVQYALFVMYVHEGRLGAVLDLRRSSKTVVSLLTSKTYVASFLVINAVLFGVGVVMGFLLALNGVLALLGLPIFFGGFVISYHFLGSHVGSRWAVATAERESRAAETAPAARA